MPTVEVQPAHLVRTSVSGAWERRGRSIGDGPRAEPSLVIWLQVGTFFTDVRLPRAGLHRSHPLDSAQAFSGTLSLESGQAMWRHDLDTARRLPGQLDHATLEADGVEMIERGAGYVEYWCPCAPASAREAVIELRHPAEVAVPASLRTASTGAPGLFHSHPAIDLDSAAPYVLAARLVRVGAYAAAVWSTPKPGGCLFQRRPALSTGGVALTASSGLVRRWAVVGLVGSPLGGRAALEALSALDGGTPLPDGWAPAT
jgi:hypothetical protein